MTASLFAAGGPAPRVQPVLKYDVYVYRTRTGEVVDQIQYDGTPDWERGLNIPGHWKVTPTLDNRYTTREKLNGLIEPWYWSWAIAQGDQIHQAGPVVGEDFSDDGSNRTTILGQGLWSLFKEKRIVVNAARTYPNDVTSFDADLAFGTVTVTTEGIPIPLERRNLSLHTIAKRLLQNEVAKPGGSLPMDLVGIADIPGAATRTYLAAQLASTGDALFNLTQVVNGPEIEFVHYFTDSSKTHIRHQPLIGNTRLGQLGYPHYWVYGKAVTKIGYRSEGIRMTSRHWDRGAGFDRNVYTGFAENMDGVTTGTFQNRPLLETASTLHSSSENTTELANYAYADVENGRTPDRVLDVEVQMEGDTGDGTGVASPPFSVVAPGDTGVIWVEGHPRLEDGKYEVRVIRMGPGSSFKRGVLGVEVLGFTPKPHYLGA